MAKKKESVKEEPERIEEVEEMEDDEWEDDDYEEDEDYEDDSYEEAMRLQKEEQKKLKEEVLEQAFQQDVTKDIRKNYHFLLKYGTFVKVLSIIGSALVAITYIVLACLSGEPFFLIPAIIFVIVLLLIGYLIEAILKWLAYILKMLYEINKKLK